MDLIHKEVIKTNKIELLPSSVANLIAAGEVIDRPAAIIKELLENSIDAGSDNITVTIEHAGNSLIRITDNGCGIDKDDLPLAICQHATSKLREPGDLDCINTLGFRGEALASICAVSKCKLTSRSLNSDLAWSLEINQNNYSDSTAYNINPASHPIGTTVEVRDLFYNLPVRKRFLKSDKTEYQQILEMFQKIALSNFSVSFTLINDNKEVYKLLKTDISSFKVNRVKKIFGNNFVQHASCFEGSAQGLSLSGWLGNGNLHRSQADQQYFFLNNRTIRDKLILHAIKAAYNDIMPNGRHPCYILYLTIDPTEVDVNVHPAKHEVRFINSRWVYQFVLQQLKQVLYPKTMQLIADDFSKFNTQLLDDLKKYDNLVIDNNYVNNCGIKTENTILEKPPTINSGLEESRIDNNLILQKSLANQQIKLVNIIDNKDKLNKNSLNKDYQPIGTLGEIIISFSNYLLITKVKDADKNNYYLVDLKLAFSYLIYKELERQLENNKITSNSLVTEHKVLLVELFEFINILDKNIFLNKIVDILNIIRFFGFDFKHNYSNTDDEFNIIYDTGEIVNGLILTKIPFACRYADGRQLFFLALQHLFLDNANFNLILSYLSLEQDNNFESNNILDVCNNFLIKLAANSMGRIGNNLLPIEQQAIINKLASLADLDLIFMDSKVIKSLEPHDLRLLLRV